MASGADRDAFAEVVRAVQPEVWRFAVHLVGPEQAEDVTQETFVRAWRASASFRGESTALTWILTICRRVCAETWKRNQRHLLVVEAHRRRPTGPHPGGQADHSGAVELNELIDRLDPERRSAFVLTQILGVSYAEAAQICGCPVGTIRSRVARARRDLTAMAEDHAAGNGANQPPR